MGDPKKHRKKYSTPTHPWEGTRIEEEKALTKEYGFRNKAEIWKMGSFLRKAAAQAKKLVTLTGDQAEKERTLLLERMKRYGLLPADAGLDAILSITLRDVLERRLQTQVYKKKLANSVKQARQFITHGHVTVDGKKITSPSYLVTLKEQDQIAFVEKSSLSDPEHPERAAARNAKEELAKEVVLDENKGKFKGKPRGKPTGKPRGQDKRSSAKPTPKKS